LFDSKAFTADELNIALIIEEDPGVDVFCPYCQRIGVLAGDKAQYELVDLDHQMDDIEVEATS
jgi:hypothetical protein